MEVDRPNRSQSGEGEHSVISTDEDIADSEDGLLPDFQRPINVSTAPDRETIVQESKDKFSLIFLVFYALGIASLLPYNFFITVDSYWMYKFRNVTPTINGTEPPYDPRHKTYLQKSFMSYLTAVSSVSAVLFMSLHTLYGHHLNIPARILSSLSALMVIFMITSGLVFVNTDDDEMLFFWVTMATVVVINALMAVSQGGACALAGRFPVSYMGAMVSGQAIAGILAALARIVSIAIGASPVKSAFVYFAIAVGIIFLTLVFYLLGTRAPYYRAVITSVQDVDEDSTDLLSNSQSQLMDKTLVPREMQYALNITLAVSNGYLICLAMMYAPLKLTDPHEQEMAGSMMILFLGVGLCFGAGLSVLLVRLL
ncbi:unnamed protein product [Cyprideis torosa]|uniref:Uncharacterized protein n=1 Tax=Cyprideis torosa TaxID=163714 RepID=A0A7R8WBV7_9CRUS|nr:unnamed protein product [Cyprideis torosa]CAG0887790.1 unnamed protein product [Cyprideis torosa]